MYTRHSSLFTCSIFSNLRTNSTEHPDRSTNNSLKYCFLRAISSLYFFRRSLACNSRDNKLKVTSHPKNIMPPSPLTDPWPPTIVCTYSRNGGLRALLHFAVGEFKVEQLLHVYIRSYAIAIIMHPVMTAYKGNPLNALPWQPLINLCNYSTCSD